MNQDSIEVNRKLFIRMYNLIRRFPDSPYARNLVLDIEREYGNELKVGELNEPDPETGGKPYPIKKAAKSFENFLDTPMSRSISGSPPEITDELVKKVAEFLGKEGIDFFKKCVADHGKITAVFNDGGIPHAVHFQEGMQLRNFMRGTGLCDNWSDHELDDYWSLVVQRVLDVEKN